MNVNSYGTIEISGISDNFPPYSNTFKQFHLQKILCVPNTKPNIHQILHANVNTKICNKYSISSSKAFSHEGQILKECNLVIHGIVLLKIEYVSCEIDHSVHAAEFKIPFSNYIVMNKCITYNSKILVSSYIEDVFIEQINKRKLFANILLLINSNYCKNN
ncbi:DUF3794 domain-containing protein [Clostridium aestuarii]|uniref:DUF3794 domain-containing protein n=1 Tax=Clostridium aestuarii TaxID=338193 RepID=A0ABT4CW01_9CLOT|nr:SPOCS domain-containing protein [Clostridium aestuarii]MCY6483171.1 DUF3794 domain-containing protein [Clostridium aestuarii]